MQIEYKLSFRWGPRQRTFLTPPVRDPDGRAPRLARMLALAHKLEGLVRSGAVKDYSELARLGHVSASRVSQILLLLYLSPPIQEQVLFLDAASAHLLTEQDLQQLHQWLEARFALKQVEPNSGLGKAITYLLRHWKGLTAFLREAGAPLDNNVCERALKRAVLHRKNALFYRTLRGAEAGDLFMSLIHTCELSNANPFDYLAELQKHPAELASNPAAWMPWN
jgi:transposase IS66 family protein